MNRPPRISKGALLLVVVVVAALWTGILSRQIENAKVRQRALLSEL